MASDALTPVPEHKNRNVAVMLFVLVVGMVGAAYAAVPLYQLFCKATGYGGTPRVATDNPKGIITRQMTTRFDSNVDAGLAWEVKAAPTMTGDIGGVETAVFIARNLTNHTITGTAGFNVTPERVGVYFNKIQCFCFTEQTLKPGETAQMPVTFFVDPDIDKDDELKTIKEITLSYTFYASKNKGS